MKGRNTLLLKKLFIAILLIIICTTSSVYATDVTPGDGDTTESTEPSGTTTLPHIEMKVKAVKIGESNQILIEMWGSNFTNFEGMEFVFTYNNEKLTPSNVSDNNIVENLDSYKYEKRPTQAGDKPTPEEKLKEAQFLQESTDTLSKAFSFETEYTDLLGIDLFRYLAPEGNNEAMQFTMSKKDKDSDISATDPVLLGKLSFRQTEGTTLDETELATSRIKVSCNDGLTPGTETQYERNILNGENCEEIVEFTYEKYGSISGTIEIGYYKDGSGYQSIKGKKIATIKIYKASDVSSIDWTITGNSYRDMRAKLQPYVSGKYAKQYRIDKNVEPEIKPIISEDTKEEDNGIFKIEKIPFGEYVVLICKEDFGDVIFTTLNMNSENKDIDLGNIELALGDFNKDGIINQTDRQIFTILYNSRTTFKDEYGYIPFDVNDDEMLNPTDRQMAQQTMQYMLKQTNKQVEVKHIN